MMLSEEEKEFRKELHKSVGLVIQKYGSKLQGGSWRGIEETILKVRIDKLKI